MPEKTVDDLQPVSGGVEEKVFSSDTAGVRFVSYIRGPDER